MVHLIFILRINSHPKYFFEVLGLKGSCFPYSSFKTFETFCGFDLVLALADYKDEHVANIVINAHNLSKDCDIFYIAHV